MGRPGCCRVRRRIRGAGPDRRRQPGITRPGAQETATRRRRPDPIGRAGRQPPGRDGRPPRRGVDSHLGRAPTRLTGSSRGCLPGHRQVRPTARRVGRPQEDPRGRPVAEGPADWERRGRDGPARCSPALSTRVRRSAASSSGQDPGYHLKQSLTARRVQHRDHELVQSVVVTQLG